MTKPNPDMESAYSYTVACTSNMRQKVNPMCAAMSMASRHGLHVMGPPAAGESAPISPEVPQAHGLATPATPSAAVVADGPGAGDILVDGDTFPRSVIDGLELQIRVLQGKVEGKDRVLTEQREEIRRLTKLNHHLREVAVMAIVERVPSDSKPSNSINPESEDTPPHNPVMGPVVGTATVTLRDWCQKSSGTRFPEPATDKPFRLEHGKRYLRRDGEVSGTLTATHSGYTCRSTFPFFDFDNQFAYRTDGTYSLTGSTHGLDLIAEYNEPEPSPAESPDDWVTQDRVPARVALDEYRVSGSQSEPGVWKRCIYGTFPIVHGYQHGRPLITGTGNSTLELRCRRRDLPVVPIKAPVTKLSSSVDVNRPENTKTRTVTLREYEEVGAHSVWSTSVSEYSFTGRTTVVEVPE